MFSDTDILLLFGKGLRQMNSVIGLDAWMNFFHPFILHLVIASEKMAIIFLPVIICLHYLEYKMKDEKVMGTDLDVSCSHSLPSVSSSVCYHRVQDSVYLCLPRLTLN